MKIKFFSSLFKEFRSNARLSQGELAKKLDIDPSLVSKIENARKIPSVKLFVKLPEVFELDFPNLVKFHICYNDLLTPEAKLKLLLEHIPSSSYILKKILLDNENYNKESKEKFLELHKKFEKPFNIGIFHFFYKTYLHIYKEKDIYEFCDNPLRFYDFIAILKKEGEFSINSNELCETYEIKKLTEHIKNKENSFDKKSSFAPSYNFFKPNTSFGFRKSTEFKTIPPSFYSTSEKKSVSDELTSIVKNFSDIKAGENFVNKKGELDYKFFAPDFTTDNRFLKLFLQHIENDELLNKRVENNPISESFFLLCSSNEDIYLVDFHFSFDKPREVIDMLFVMFDKMRKEANPFKAVIDDFNNLLKIIEKIPDKKRRLKALHLLSEFFKNFSEFLGKEK